MSGFGRDALALALSLRPDLIGRDEADALLLRVMHDPLRSFGRGAGGSVLLMKLERWELPRRVASDVREWLERRIDFEAYLDAGRRIEQEGFPFHVPRIRASNPEHRTLEFDDPAGHCLADLLGRHGELAARGIEAEAVAGNLLDRSLEAIFERKLFVETLHPSDLTILGRAEIAFRHPAITTGIDDTIVGHAIRIYRALRDGSSDRAASAVLDLIGAHDAPRAGELRQHVAALLRAAIAGDSAMEIARSKFVVSETMIEILRAARDHRIAVPRLVRAIALNLITIERIVRLLGAGTSLREIGREFFEELLLRRAADLISGEALSGAAFDLLALLRNVPGDLHAILTDLADERFRLRVITTDSDEDRKLKNLRSRMIALSIAAAALLLLVSAPSMPFAARLGVAALLAACTAWLALAWWRLR